MVIYTCQFEDWGNYSADNMFGEKYFRGYDAYGYLGKKSGKNYLQWPNGGLNTILINTGKDREQKIASGRPLKLAQGYELYIESITAYFGGHIEITLSLSRKGVSHYKQVISPSQPNADLDSKTFLYKSPVVGVVTLAIHFKDLYLDGDTIIFTIDGIWQISHGPIWYGWSSAKKLNNPENVRFLTSPLIFADRNLQYRIAAIGFDLRLWQARLKLDEHPPLSWTKIDRHTGVPSLDPITTPVALTPTDISHYLEFHIDYIVAANYCVLHIKEIQYDLWDDWREITGLYNPELVIGHGVNVEWISKICAVQSPDNRAFVIVKYKGPRADSTAHIYYTSQAKPGDWRGATWKILGPQKEFENISRPFLVANSEKITVFIFGDDGDERGSGIWSATIDFRGKSSSWSLDAEPPLAPPRLDDSENPKNVPPLFALINDNGFIETFCVGYDKNIWHLWQNRLGGGLAKRESLRKPVDASKIISIQAAQLHDGNIIIFAGDVDGKIYYTKQLSGGRGWNSWNYFGGGLPSKLPKWYDLTLFRGPPFFSELGRLEIIVRSEDNSGYGNFWYMAEQYDWEL